jgi:hypothetical protein
MRTIGNVVLGAAAGAAATWVMGKATAALLEREDPMARVREEMARGGETTYAIVAGKLGEWVGADWDAEQREQVGLALHYGLGATGGAVYGALRPRSIGSGLALGLALFAAVDEGVSALAGLPPRWFPWQTHARGLAGHLVYGAATEVGLRALRAGAARSAAW